MKSTRFRFQMSRSKTPRYSSSLPSISNVSIVRQHFQHREQFPTRSAMHTSRWRQVMGNSAMRAVFSTREYWHPTDTHSVASVDSR